MFSFRDLRMEFKSPFRITIQFNFKDLLPKNSALELIIVTGAIDAMLFIMVKERKGCFAYYK